MAGDAPVDRVFVPHDPGPLIEPQLPDGDDALEVALDDLFGQDDTGPGRNDVALVVGGGAAVVLGQVLDLAAVGTVRGAAALALGLVLPIRSLLDRWSSRRRATAVADQVGDAVPLRQDQVSLVRLAGLHSRILGRSADLEADIGRRVVAVAHAQVMEVATLLDGQVPVDGTELDYVEARVESLRGLVAVIEGPGFVDGRADERRAAAEARVEVEEAAGRSALTDAADLRDQLAKGHDT